MTDRARSVQSVTLRHDHADMAHGDDAGLFIRSPRDWRAVVANDPWNLLRNIACDACRAEDGGLVFDRQGDEPREAYERRLDSLVERAIARRLASFPAGVRWTDNSTGIYYAAVALQADSRIGFLWVCRAGGAFDWREMLRLRTFGALATSLWGLQRSVAESELMLQLHLRHAVSDLTIPAAAFPCPSARQSNDIGLRLGRTRGAKQGDLFSRIRESCEALGAEVQERGISIYLSIEGSAEILSDRDGSLLLIAVDELVTNAIRHAFPSDDGTISVAVWCAPDRVFIAVQDDGVPLPLAHAVRPDSGLDIIARLVAGAGGTMIMPQDAAKKFTIELPLG